MKYQRLEFSLQIEILLTETLRALSLHTEALQNVYKRGFHCTIFWYKSGTLTMSFFLPFIEEGEEKLIKEVGETFNLLNLNKMVETFAPLLLN